MYTEMLEEQDMERKQQKILSDQLKIDYPGIPFSILEEQDMERKQQKILSDQLKIDYPDIPFSILERDTGWSTNDGLIHFVNRQTKAVYYWHQKYNKWSIRAPSGAIVGPSGAIVGPSGAIVGPSGAIVGQPPISNEIAVITNYILRDTFITPETKKQLLDYQHSLVGKPNVVGKSKVVYKDLIYKDTVQPFSIQPQTQYFQ